MTAPVAPMEALKRLIAVAKWPDAHWFSSAEDWNEFQTELAVAEMVVRDYVAPVAQPAQQVEAVWPVLSADDVQWITNDNAELGVKIGNQFFFLYKGGSLVYENGAHDDDTQMMYRPVFKREFGECAHPINHNDYSKIGTVSLSDSDDWKPIAAAPQLEAQQVGDVALKEAVAKFIKAKGRFHTEQNYAALVAAYDAAMAKEKA